MLPAKSRCGTAADLAQASCAEPRDSCIWPAPIYARSPTIKPTARKHQPWGLIPANPLERTHRSSLGGLSATHKVSGVSIRPLIPSRTGAGGKLGSDQASAAVAGFVA